MKNIWNTISRYIQFFFALFLAALSFNMFLLPTEIVAGGVNGVAIILKDIIPIQPAMIIFIISFICLVLGAFLIKKEKVATALIGTIIYPVFVELTLPLTRMLNVQIDDLFLVSIIVGIISGFTSGIIYRNNFNAGGFNIISQILYKYLKISISKSSFVINTIIVLGGAFTFGWTNAMYAIIILFINSVIMDKVILGISSKKAFYIITKKSFEVERFIIDELNHGVTIFNAKGGFLIKNKKMIMAVVPSREYYMLTEGIKEIDPNAFFLATDAYQTFGER